MFFFKAEKKGHFSLKCRQEIEFLFSIMKLSIRQETCWNLRRVKKINNSDVTVINLALNLHAGEVQLISKAEQVSSVHA